ncbi:MAG: RtcB family protein [Puniceicoccaceae bacterium]|nr:MAG: RtcB family protein [Puniceicoccaceae bacterium]
MTSQELARLGLTRANAREAAIAFIRNFREAGGDPTQLEDEITAILADPPSFLADPLRGDLARILADTPPSRTDENPAPWRQWGGDLEPEAVGQLATACRLPIALQGALMPDAHVGYGLPIGGVLATDNAVIPYGVGVDIACRMKLSVYDVPGNRLAGWSGRLANIIESETRFGIGAAFKQKRDHPVLDEDWSVSPITKSLHGKAWSQLGTSGSGNHFVEFGILTVADESVGLPPGEYLALLSHSGSRGAGAQVCQHYSRLAMERRPDLPKEFKRLAWLDLDSAEGQEYWAAMNLMGRYAAANHAVIHRHIAKALGEKVALDLENHHNFAWKEIHRIGGREREVIVHRKGATPAAAGVLGIIPGTMASPGFVVRGKGLPASLNSAAHGAGRVMSRKKAHETQTWSRARKLLQERGVTLLSAGLDEVPFVYKDIHSVMAAQADLVEVLARFDPKLVKMSPPGEKAED